MTEEKKYQSGETIAWYPAVEDDAVFDQSKEQKEEIQSHNIVETTREAWRQIS